MKTSEQINEISEALVKVLPEIANLYPSKQSYGYNYIPLGDVIDEIKSKLQKHDLCFIQMPVSDNGQSVGITTRAIHKSGQWIESTYYALPTTLKGVNNTQQIGASITYLRRYGLISMFGITGDSDVDGNIKSNAQNAISKQNKQQDNKNTYIAEKSEVIALYEKVRSKITDEKIHFYFQISLPLPKTEYNPKQYKKDKEQLSKLL